MAESNFKSTMEALFHGMDNVISSKTVVGEAIHVKDTIILPLVDVSVSVGAGSFTADKNEKGAGGLGLILNEKIGWREYSSVGMILVVLFVTVFIIETISRAARRRLV